MRISRKIKREQLQQARKAFRHAIRDEVIAAEYRKRFIDGYNSGYDKGREDALAEIKASMAPKT